MKEKKNIDVQALLVYIAMFLLVLVIALPPIFRVALKDEEETTPKVKAVTALMCRRSVTTDLTQYNISVNSAYKDDLERVTFVYRTSPITDTETQVTPDQTPVQDNTQVQTPDATTTPEQPTVPVSDSVIQEEINILKAIPGIVTEDSENETRLVITKQAASNFEEGSTYKNYFQGIDEQQAYFESIGYSCSILKG